MSGSVPSPELNARVGLMFSKRIRIRSLMKGRFWGASVYIYIYVCIRIHVQYVDPKKVKVANSAAK